jgi:hypothetical protein
MSTRYVGGLGASSRCQDASSTRTAPRAGISYGSSVGSIATTAPDDGGVSRSGDPAWHHREGVTEAAPWRVSVCTEGMGVDMACRRIAAALQDIRTGKLIVLGNDMDQATTILTVVDLTAQPEDLIQ